MWLALHGYFVALPNLLYRAGTFARRSIPRTVFGDPAERDRLRAIMKQASVPAVMRDLPFLLDALATRPEARADQVGCIGYCMGGRTAFVAAGTYPARVAAAASIHGGGLATAEADSPHRLAPAIRARLYFGVADDDRSCTPESQAMLKAALDEAKVRLRASALPRRPARLRGPGHAGVQ